MTAKIDFPILFVSVLVPLLGSFLFPIIENKVEKKTLSFLCFALLIVPSISILFIFLRYGWVGLVTEPALFAHQDLGSFSMYLDRLSGLYFLGVGLVTPLVALYSRNYMEYRIRTMEKEEENVASLGTFYLAYTIFSAAMMGFVLTTNLILQYVFLNMTVMASFLLILLYGHGNRQRTAHMYLIWSMVGGAIFLLGIIGLGYYSGTFDLVDLEAMELNLGIGEGLPLFIPFLLFFGMCIKKALFGVHIWLPHAHAEAPSPVSALLSPNLIGISGYAMIRVVLDIFPAQFEQMSIFFLIFAFITMIYGGLNAIAQDDLKKLLAYASVSQMGWVVFGIATMTPEGQVGGILLFVKHSISLSVLFMGAGILVEKYDGLRDISNMGELWSLHPVLSTLMIIGFLTLVGSPLTMGFWGKALIFSGAIKMPFITGPLTFILVALAIVLAGGITAGYVFITVKRMFFGMFKGDMEPRTIGWSTSTYPMAAISLVGIFLFFVPSFLFGPAELPTLPVLTIEGLMFLTAYLGAYTIFSGGIRYYLVLFSHRVENEVLDNFFHKKILSFIKRSDEVLEHTHPITFDTYLLWLVIGFLGVLLTLLFL